MQDFIKGGDLYEFFEETQEEGQSFEDWLKVMLRNGQVKQENGEFFIKLG